MPAGQEQHIDEAAAARASRTERIPRTAVFAVPLAIYALIIIPTAIVYRDRLNIDAICYIRRALYLVHGDFYHAISGYWSPMISWCIAPFLAIGMNGLHAAHVVVCLWGAALIVAFGAFLHTFTSFPRWLNMAAMGVMAVFLRTEAVREITPDIILATWLMLYLSAVMSKRLLESRRMQLLAGVLGGLAYLAKAYALPFVLVHLPITFAIRGWVQCRKNVGSASADPTHLPAAGLWRPASGLLIALLAFAIVAGPWVGVLSWRYKRLAFSTVASRAHAVVGPKKGHPSTSQLPPDPYILQFENPEDLPYRFWSPFDSDRMYQHQLTVIRDNLGEIIHGIRDFDRFGLGWIAILAGAAAVLPIVQRPGQRWKTLWLLMTIVLYCCGFLPVFFIPRYINPLILPLSLTLGLCLVMFWGDESRDRRSPANRTRMALAAIIIFSFACDAIGERVPGGRGPDIHLVARTLTEAGINGPIASSERRYGRQIAFDLEQKFVHLPGREKNAVELNKKLRDYGVAAILVWSDLDDEEAGREARLCARRDANLLAQPNWRELPGEVYPGLSVYVRADKNR